MTFKDLILHERNISLIYLFSILSYIACYFAIWNVDGIREFVPITILAVILSVGEIILLLLPAVAGIVGLKQKTIRKIPAILTITPIILILLYFTILTITGWGFLGFRLDSFMKLMLDLAVPLSVLYGFAAFAVRSKTANAKAAKVLGILHALEGAGMTFFYYKIYSTAQAYDYGVPIPDVWYYSPESLLIGYGIWALLGAAAGILMLTDKTKS
ncbi:MAG: hypothetical protein E7Z71_04760 [Methanocorpusculum parvum]|nr:hypothetical protein [Methanocorpusculum parvum]